MKLIYSTAFVILFMFACANKDQKSKLPIKDNKEVSFYASDSVKLYGDFFEVGKEVPTILLFHQARSNARGEYASIAKRLFKNGFNVLAIDQRSGGQLYGSYNRTIANFNLNSYSYCDAYKDLGAALDFLNAAGFEKKKIIWGSSYSAALVIKLGAEKPDEIKGILAFSPASGEPMEGCSPSAYFDQIKVPLLILRPEREAAYESVKEQLELAKSFGFNTYVSKNGVHGSSMLDESRTKFSTDKTWTEVENFISSL